MVQLNILTLLTTTAAAILLLPTALAAPTYSCLTAETAEALLTEWSNLFLASPELSNVPKVVTKNFKYFQQVDTPGTYSKPWVTGPAAYAAQLKAQSDPTTATLLSYKQEQLFWFFSCDKIASRWINLSKTTGYQEKISGIPKGIKTRQEGTDLLKVDLASKKVFEAYTTFDSVVYFD